MDLQGTINQTLGQTGQSIAVARMLGQDHRAGIEAQNDINDAKDRLADNSIKQAQMPKYTRADSGRWLSAMDDIQNERQALIDQKNALVAYYQSLYHGVSDEGKVDLTKFRDRLIPKKVTPKTETVPTAEEIVEEEIDEADKEDRRLHPEWFAK